MAVPAVKRLYFYIYIYIYVCMYVCMYTYECVYIYVCVSAEGAYSLEFHKVPG